MFRSNTITHLSSNITYSHRDNKFFKLYKQLQEKLIINFGLKKYEILFVPGSVTTGIESFFFSMIKKIEVIGHEWKFTERWKRLAKLYNVTKLEIAIKYELFHVHDRLDTYQIFTYFEYNNKNYSFLKDLTIFKK